MKRNMRRLRNGFLVLTACGTVAALTACPEPEKPKFAPSGVAGAPTGTNATAPVAPAATAPGSMPATAHQAVAPGSMPAVAHGGAAASQPAAAGQANPALPTVVKGNGTPPPAMGNHPTYAGKVEETMNAAGYTYVRVKTSKGNEIWAAVTETKLTVGQTVSLTESLTMSDFHSKTLNRTFPSIVFATLN